MSASHTNPAAAPDPGAAGLSAAELDRLVAATLAEARETRRTVAGVVADVAAAAELAAVSDAEHDVELARDIFAAAESCLNDPDPAARLAGLSLIRDVAEPLALSGDDHDLDLLWDVCDPIEQMSTGDRNRDVRESARRVLDHVAGLVWEYAADDVEQATREASE